MRRGRIAKLSAPEPRKAALHTRARYASEDGGGSGSYPQSISLAMLVVRWTARVGHLRTNTEAGGRRHTTRDFLPSCLLAICLQHAEEVSKVLL